MRMSSVLTAAFAALAISIPPADVRAAVADRDSLPDESRPWVYYLTTYSAPEGEARDNLAAAICFAVPSASREQVLERQIPVKISDTVYRIDLRGLAWDKPAFRESIAKHPYTDGVSMIFRADWFLIDLTDTQESDTYYKLLYGDKAPKTGQEFLKFWNIETDKPEFDWGVAEEDSGVSTQKKRLVRSRPGIHGRGWQTFDFLKIEKGKDPLEDPLGREFKSDGSEFIAPVPKLSLRTGERSISQVYFLAGGDDAKADRAPVDLVSGGGFRGLQEIRTWGSCVICHTTGLNGASVNGVRKLIEDGAEIYSKNKEDAEAIEAFHLSKTQKYITRSNEDYATFVLACNGLEAPANAAAFKKAIDGYDADVTLAQAALELACEAGELQLALAWYSEQYELPARLVSLAHRKPIRRTSWEQYYFPAKFALKAWRAK